MRKRGRRGSNSIVANPVLVGAVTLLVTIVAVFLAYNANSGLPFVPSRQFTAHMTSGSNLVKGNEIREGGFRVGVVEDLKPRTLPDGRSVAELKLKFDRKYGELPTDSRLIIRPRSALGLKYVELDRGTSKETFDEGATIPLRQTTVPVQFDDLFRTFDEPTRDAQARNLDGFGNAFTGRGQDLNLAIRELPELFRVLEPVAATLTAEETQLPRFFSELGDAARVVAPIASVQVKAFRDGGTTFEAFSRDPEALKATIAKSPSTLEVSTRSLRDQRPFLRETAAFSSDLRAATAELRVALPDINPALEEGVPVLERSVELNDELRGALQAGRELAETPTTTLALQALTSTVGTLNPTVRYLGPYQTVCNYWNYFWTFVGEHLSEADQTGTAQRALLNSTANQDDGLGSIGAKHPAQGKNYNPATQTRGDVMFLHGQTYGAAINSDGTADCENGQRGYPEGKMNTLGKDPVVFDPHSPGSQGPTYKGRPRVPTGQTFSREPTTGIGLPAPLQTP